MPSSSKKKETKTIFMGRLKTNKHRPSPGGLLRRRASSQSTEHMQLHNFPEDPEDSLGSVFGPAFAFAAPAFLFSCFLSGVEQEEWVLLRSSHTATGGPF